MKKLYILFMFALLNFTAMSQIPTNGLIAYYPFNGNANDESGNGHNGTVYGATLTTDRFGNENNAYLFNGINNYILSTGLPTNYSKYTFAGWVKGNTTTLVDHGIIVQTGRDAPIGSFGISAGLKSANRYDGRHRISSDELVSIQSINTPDLNWHFYTLSWDGSTLLFYVDNVLQGQLTGIAGTSSISNELLIGALRYSAGTVDKYFSGIIDDVRIYDLALTQSEITSLYNEVNPSNSMTNYINGDNKITVYPNPANEIVNIDMSSYIVYNNSKIEIYKITGELIKILPMQTSSIQLNISELSKGVYFIKITNDNAIVIKRIIKD